MEYFRFDLTLQKKPNTIPFQSLFAEDHKEGGVVGMMEDG